VIQGGVRFSTSEGDADVDRPNEPFLVVDVVAVPVGTSKRRCGYVRAKDVTIRE